MSRSIEVPDYEVHADVRIDPARTALVVVDMQNDFVREGGGLLVPDAEATIPAINRLLQFARAHGIRVVYSQDTHRDGDPVSGESGPSTLARAPGAGRLSTSSRRRKTMSSCASFAGTRSTARRSTTCCGCGALTHL